MLKKFVSRFILNYKIKHRKKAKWTWEWKWFIGTACRWIRRTFTNLCQIDLKANAQGITDIISARRNKEQKDREFEKYILLPKDMSDSEKKKTLEHLNNLSKEIDPLENVDEIPENSVNTTHANIETIDRR